MRYYDPHEFQEQGCGQNDQENEQGTVIQDSVALSNEIERPPQRYVDKYIRAKLPCLPTRYTVALMTSLGFLIAFGIRCNMPMAKLVYKMETKSGKLDVKSVLWESAVDSAFFWGYLASLIPGGFLGCFFPSNRIFGAGIIGSSICNLLIPSAFEQYELVIVRFVQGLFEGVTYPACYGMWRFWAPTFERSIIAAIAFSASHAGILIGIPFSEYLAHFNWKAPFYVYGIIGMCWYVAWLWLIFEKPRKHPTIDVSELQYIEKSLGKSVQQSLHTKATIPWYDIVRSMPVIAIVVATFCRSWNFYMLVLYKDAYFNKVFWYDTAEAGLVNLLPSLLMAIIILFGGILADYLRKSGTMTTTTTRKLFSCVGFGLDAFCLLLVAYSNSVGMSLTALTLGAAFIGFAISGYNVNHLDIAPRCASLLVGISIGIGASAGLICPVVIDHILADGTTRSWSIVFTIGACVYLFGIIFYGVFASGELQHWAEPPVDKKRVWCLAKTEHTKETAFQDEPQTDI